MTKRLDDGGAQLMPFGSFEQSPLAINFAVDGFLRSSVKHSNDPLRTIPTSH
ncbi:hypothetical protein [Levilactobacillus sp. HBUAS67488]|uniref:hypothetical protein n=1 Tax=Levilactobacillus sp. HBUAS67488 TaxID=3109361 RepID=UPI002FF1ED80